MSRLSSSQFTVFYWKLGHLSPEMPRLDTNSPSIDWMQWTMLYPCVSQLISRTLLQNLSSIVLVERWKPSAFFILGMRGFKNFSLISAASLSTMPRTPLTLVSTSSSDHWLPMSVLIHCVEGQWRTKKITTFRNIHQNKPRRTQIHPSHTRSHTTQLDCSTQS